MNDRLRYYGRERKSLPAEVLIKKFFSKVERKGFNAIHKISANILSTKMTEAEFLRRVWNSKYEFENVEELQKYFHERKEPKFVIDSRKRESTVSLIYECFPDAPEKIVAQADKICDHIFDLLGSGPVKVYHGMEAKDFEGHCYNAQIKRKALTTIHNYEPIDWHCDFKSGYRWNPKKYHKDIKIPYGEADIKIPWELSRFQHLSVLGQAYWLTNDERYVREFINQIADWIDNNKPKFGVNWRCTMDVAIRACNWILGYCFFKDSEVINQQFLFKFLKSLYQHGCHIIENLEKSEVLTSNHYLSDIVGLVYLGVLVPEFKESKKWENFGIEELKKEMKKQVHPDGVDFEGSTCYHRLVLELFFYTTFLVIINCESFEEENFIEAGNEILGEEYLQRLYKMFEFILYALKPNGRMPQIGDNDNGRLHIFTKREVLDMRYLLTLGAIFFKEPKFKVKEFGFWEEALWVFGESGYKIWQDLEETCLADIGSHAFPDAGWYIMRNHRSHMTISCGPNGQDGNGGHCHNHKLSFDLCTNGKDIIVDPGTYVYTAEPKWRNRFRSTAYHNTVVVDGSEQNSFDGKNLFWTGNDAEVRINEWEVNAKYDFLDAQHSGYECVSECVTHRRQVLFNKEESYWVVRDVLTGKGEHAFELYFHFGPIKGLGIDKENPLVVWSDNQDEANIAVIPIETDVLKVSIEDSWISSSYGKKIRAPLVKYSTVAQVPTAFTVVLYPFEKLRPVAEDVKNRVLAYWRTRVSPTSGSFLGRPWVQ